MHKNKLQEALPRRNSISFLLKITWATVKKTLIVSDANPVTDMHISLACFVHKSLPWPICLFMCIVFCKYSGHMFHFTKNKIQFKWQNNATRYCLQCSIALSLEISENLRKRKSFSIVHFQSEILYHEKASSANPFYLGRDFLYILFGKALHS